MRRDSRDLSRLTLTRLGEWCDVFEYLWSDIEMADLYKCFRTFVLLHAMYNLLIVVYSARILYENIKLSV